MQVQQKDLCTPNSPSELHCRTTFAHFNDIAESTWRRGRFPFIFFSKRN